jgi:hypothetical protein
VYDHSASHKKFRFFYNPAKFSQLFLSIVFSNLLFVSGCGTLENGWRWGQDAFWPIDFNRIGRAAHDAFFDPQTLVPLGGALVFAIDDFDERVSDWAVKHNPIFNSVDDAKDASDYLKDALEAEVLITALATPGGDDSGQWAYSKLRGLGVEFVAACVTTGVTDSIKDATNRERPDKSSKRSFPSAHASGAFCYMTLANRNIDSIDMPGALKPPLKIGNFLLASGVVWARVEGQRHYPSDVLAGVALGRFLTVFIHDALMNLPEDGGVDFVVFPAKNGAGVAMSFRF